MIRHIPFNTLQKAIADLLKQGQDTPVYDNLPTGVIKMPYIYLGELSGAPGVQNKTEVIHQIQQQIHVWSGQRGKEELSSILDDVLILLTKYQLAMDGYVQIGGAHAVAYQTFMEAYADKTYAYHGILVIEYAIQQV